jgi:uncharacterized protein YcfJ
MNRIAATALALALSAASGSAFANHDDYRYDDRYGTQYGNDYGYHDPYRRTRYVNARVISVHPIFDRSRSDRYCRDDGYSHRYEERRYGGSARANGAALGAVVGGALGNQAGKGDGRKAATVAGAVIGGMIGAEVAGQNERRVQGDNRYGNDGYYGDNRYGNDGYYGDNRSVRCSGYGYEDGYGRDDRYGYGDGYGRDDRYGYGDAYGRDDRYGRGYEGRVIGYNVAYRLDGRTYRTRTDHHPGNTIRVRVNVLPDGRRIAYGD